MILTHTILFKFFGGASAVDDTVVDTGVAIVNTDATEEPSLYNVCQLTGFRVLPGHLRQQYDGTLVRYPSFTDRNIQDFVRILNAEQQTGPRFGENADDFVDEVKPEDL